MSAISSSFSKAISCVFERMPIKDLLQFRGVCKQWQQLINSGVLQKAIERERAFGPKKWEHHLGDVGVGVPLRNDIEAILRSICPFSKEQESVHKTSSLLWVPDTLNEKQADPIQLEVAAKNPRKGPKSCYVLFDRPMKRAFGSQKPLPGHWLLIVQTPIFPEKGESLDQLRQRLKKIAPEYDLLPIQAAVAHLITTYVSSGKRPLEEKLTRCQETFKDSPTIVGLFGQRGLHISYEDSKDYRVGLLISRRLS